MMAFYVFEDRDNLASYIEIKDSDSNVPLPSNNYIAVDQLPIGDGVLKVSISDNKLWFEPYQHLPVPENIEPSIPDKLQAMDAQYDFLEECIIELAQQVYS